MSSQIPLIPAAIVACIAMYASIYLLGIRRGDVRPVLATWVLLSLATIMSFVTDFAETGLQGMRTNFFNMADTVAVIVILIVVLLQKHIRRSFNSFDTWCICASLAITIF